MIRFWTNARGTNEQTTPSFDACVDKSVTRWSQFNSQFDSRTASPARFELPDTPPARARALIAQLIQPDRGIITSD